MFDYVDPIGSIRVDDYQKVLRKLAQLATGATFGSVRTLFQDSRFQARKSKACCKPNRCQFARQLNDRVGVNAFVFRGASEHNSHTLAGAAASEIQRQLEGVTWVAMATVGGIPRAFRLGIAE